MKHMKRILALVLALIMILGLAVTASAAAMEGSLEGGSITIENPYDGATYKAYQILYLESYDAEKGNYTYKANSDWAAWLATQTEYVTIDEDGYVTWVEGASAADFAEAAKNALDGKTEAGSVTAADGAATITGLKLGYYLVDTNMGALCSLDTTSPNVTVDEKNEVPTIVKEVQEDSDGSWGKVNDADVNQIVEYKATITVKKGAENYIAHDQMEAALDFVEVTSVTIGETTVSEENYEVKTGADATHTTGKHAGETCTFDVVFDNEFISSLAPETEIIIWYKARLNDLAVVETGIENDIDMQFGDLNDPEWTPVSTTKTYTWKLTVKKVDGETDAPLAGAKFMLTKDEEGAQILKFHTKEGVLQLCDGENCTEEKCTSEFTTDATGVLAFEGLDADTYYLHELEAPAGYNKIDDAIEVEIDSEETENGEALIWLTKNDVTEIENNAGARLPDTGGIGTTIFYIVGGLLAVTAVVLLVTKKRMASAE